MPVNICTDASTCFGGPLDPTLDNTDYSAVSQSLIGLSSPVEVTGTVGGFELYAASPGWIIIYVSFLNHKIQFIEAD